jgi:hypothetical protein
MAMMTASLTGWAGAGVAAGVGRRAASDGTVHSRHDARASHFLMPVSLLDRDDALVTLA